MGFNWKVAGYSSLTDFFEAMKRSEGEHLNAFIGFVIGNDLDDEIRHKDWAGFAYGYNGAGYKKNNYHTAMAKAYTKFARENIDCSKVSAASMPAPQVETQGELSPALADPQVVQPDLPPINVGTTSTTVEAPNGDTATATVTTATSNEPVTVKAVAMGLWSKIIAGFTAVTALGINAGTFIEAKLSEITTNQLILIAISAVMIILTMFYLKKRQEAADAKTHALILAAADRNSNTVDLTK